MSAVILGGIVIDQVLPPLAGYLRGNTANAGDPDTPVRRRVQLVPAQQNAHGHIFPNSVSAVTWVWADESGEWEVLDLDPAKRYHAIAYDHTGQYDPVIKLNLIPTVD